MLERRWLQQVRAGFQMTLSLTQIVLLSASTVLIGWFGGYSFMSKKFKQVEADLFLELNNGEDLREVIASLLSVPSQGKQDGESDVAPATSSPVSPYAWVCEKRGKHQWGHTSVESSRCIFCGVVFVELYAIDGGK
jgi:hypothetical protein